MLQNFKYKYDKFWLSGPAYDRPQFEVQLKFEGLSVALFLKLKVIFRFISHPI